MLLTARYVLPVATPHIEDGAVLVHDDRIVEIGDFEHLRALHPDEPVRDFGLAALMPGFVDLHTHLEYTAMRGLVDDLPYSRWKLQLLQTRAAVREPGLGRLGVARRARGAAVRASRPSPTSPRRAPPGTRRRRAGLRGTIYREVATMEKRRVDGVMSRAAADIAAWTDDVGPVARCVSASRRTRRTRATRSSSSGSPSTHRTARRSRSTSPAVARSTSS